MKSETPPIFILVAMLITWIIGILTGLEYKIESPKPIIPEKKLIIKDNKVDTVYIYKRL